MTDTSTIVLRMTLTVATITLCPLVVHCFNFWLMVNTNKMGADDGYTGSAFYQILGKSKNTSEKSTSSKTTPGGIALLQLDDVVNIESICGISVRTNVTDTWNIHSITVIHRSLFISRTFLLNEVLSKSSITKSVIEDGVWSSWGEWSTCCGQCGTNSLVKRSRRCSFPVQHCEGEPCRGDSEESRPCIVPPCPQKETTIQPPLADNVWSSWGEWTVCCGPCGTRSSVKRTRTCQVCGGNPCVGDSVETKTCLTPPCPTEPSSVQGEWGFWSDWSKCPDTCGVPFTIKRERSCTFSTSLCRKCIGNPQETKTCFEKCSTRSTLTTHSIRTATPTITDVRTSTKTSSTRANIIRVGSVGADDISSKVQTLHYLIYAAIVILIAFLIVIIILVVVVYKLSKDRNHERSVGLTGHDNNISVRYQSPERDDLDPYQELTRDSSMEYLRPVETKVVDLPIVKENNVDDSEYQRMEENKQPIVFSRSKE